MSLYANYIREKTDYQIIETSSGFATYRYIDEKTVYIIDLYILPDFRQTKIATSIADNIVEEAKKRGCNKLVGSVVPTAKNSTLSLRVLLGYGMTLESASHDFIVFKKEI